MEQAKARQLYITAQIESEKATELVRAERQREVNVKNIQQETELERSIKMAKITVDAEAKERTALADLFQAEQEAKAILAKNTAEADSIRLKLKAEADGQLAKY